MKKLSAAFLALFLSVSTAMAQADTIQDKSVGEYRTVLEQLLEVSGTKTALGAHFPRIIQTLRDLLPDVPDEVIVRMENKFRDLFFKDIMELYAPVYMRYMTIDEIKELIVFYNTPLGRKVAMTQPSISVDLAKAGRQAGENIAKEVLKELAAEGYKPINM